MTLCVFIGPTVAADQVGADIVRLPPAAQGDVLRAVRRYGPTGIGIVDGLFGGAPAVWHKEILWAMSEGVAVFGSASMGALRAAELHSFGMRGVGRIFEDYRDGALEDDDEVALIHGPEALGYPTLSEPMVNVRATLARAGQEGVLDVSTGAALEACAKNRHFAERTWPGVLDACDRALDAATRRRFEAWLPDHQVDQKREDALAMLAAMREAPTVPEAPFRFAVTHHWNALVTRVDAEAERPDAVEARVLDELRLGPQPLLQAMRAKALLRRSLRGGGREGAPAVGASDRLKVALGLATRERFEAWLVANHLDRAGFERLAARSQGVAAFEHAAAARLASDLLDELRLSGDFPALAARAEAKSVALTRAGNAGVLAPEARMALRHWFSARRLGGGDAALPALLEATGYEDGAALDRALHRERLYLTLAKPAPEL